MSIRTGLVIPALAFFAALFLTTAASAAPVSGFAPSIVSPVGTAPTQMLANSPCIGGGHLATSADIAGGVPAGTYVCSSDAQLISDPGVAKQDLANNFLTGSAKSRGSASTDTMVPVFACRLDNFLKAAKASGLSILIYSGVRSADTQASLATQAAQAGHPNTACGNGSAGLESCPHVQGRAADLTFNGTQGITQAQCQQNSACMWAHENAAKFQLVFPLTGNPLEPWHIEPVERANVNKDADCNGGTVPSTAPASPFSNPGGMPDIAHPTIGSQAPAGGQPGSGYGDGNFGGGGPTSGGGYPNGYQQPCIPEQGLFGFGSSNNCTSANGGNNNMMNQMMQMMMMQSLLSSLKPSTSSQQPTSGTQSSASAPLPPIPMQTGTTLPPVTPTPGNTSPTNLLVSSLQPPASNATTSTSTPPTVATTTASSMGQISSSTVPNATTPCTNASSTPCTTTASSTTTATGTTPVVPTTVTTTGTIVLNPWQIVLNDIYFALRGFFAGIGHSIQ
ncbi:MAG TPA: M15 family metallopeptidase [Candidatus Paceibacterota bacterium]|nr:M15 family metallopeptidase [Candidatus Paceibacterota bacterium]